jgi:hypothetical protein
VAADRRHGTVAAAATVLVLAVAAAGLGGSWQLQRRAWLTSSDPGAYGPPPPPPEVRAPPALPLQPGRGPWDLSWVGVVAQVLVGLLVVALLLWLGRRYVQSAVRRRTGARAGESVLTVAEPELPVLRRGVTAAQRHLDEIADPDNAIIEAWLALEAAAASSGVRRGPAETPTEFTGDVLQSTAADPAAVSRLLTLYHRARFSAAGVTREDVATAGQCLAALARSWDAMTADVVGAVWAPERGPGR